MWQFAVGMFLVTIDPTSLRLTAIYAFASSSSILLLGANVGHWVDVGHRLTGRREIVLELISCNNSTIRFIETVMM